MEDNGALGRNALLIQALKTQSAFPMKHDFFDGGFTVSLTQSEYVLKRDTVLKPVKFQIDNSKNTFPIRGFRVRAQMFIYNEDVGIDLPVVSAGEVYQGALENLSIEKIKNPSPVDLQIILINKKCPSHRDRTVPFVLKFRTDPTGPFVYNKRTEEVHDLGNEDPRCHIADITPEHRENLAKFPKKELESGEKDGCRWCLPQYHRR